MEPKTKLSLDADGFDWSSFPKTLRDDYLRTNFDLLFLKLINKNVIKILSPQLIAEPYNLVYDERLVYKHLIGPLEEFICDLDNNDLNEDEQSAAVDAVATTSRNLNLNVKYLDNSDLKQVDDDSSGSDGDVDKVFNYLQTLNEPNKLCRRILKSGDVTFSCNDCGLDSTCVLCIDCFHKSAHKDHNYRMANSDGGGCCDCGDSEAWKQNYACSDHISQDHVNPSLSDFADKSLRFQQISDDKDRILAKIQQLPKGLAIRYFLVCQACLHYARTMLTWDNHLYLPDHLDLEHKTDDSELSKLLSTDSKSKNYFTVLFNDEVHTYDHVINTLVKIIKCSKMTASIMASTVSREGRAYVINDNLKTCQQIRDMIINVRDGGQNPLKVEVIHGSVLAHQAYALKLIEWVRKMASLCDALRILTAYTLLGTYDNIPDREKPSRNMTLIERVMLTNTNFWKIARVEWNDLFVTAMLTEYSIKEQFARYVTRIYPQLMHYFIHDDHDYSVSVLTLTTQLYTVPSLICMLIEEEDALSILMQTLIDTCRNTKRESILTFENRNTFDMHSLKRALCTISDLRHLINIEPPKWTQQLKENVIHSVKIFLSLLSSMQGMDSVKRQLGQHLEYEPDWESGMTLQSRLTGFISRLVTYCSHNEEVLIEILRESQEKLLKIANYKMVTKELFGHQTSCIQYDVSSSLVSVHLPLTRFAASLIIELMQRRPCETKPYDESLIILTNDISDSSGNSSCERQSKQSMIDIMEPSLRTEVMIAQFRSGMWRRNGYSLVNQILYFHGALMRKEMFDRDILVLQECAAMCDANKFMIHLVNKFFLFTWVTSETTRQPLVGPKAFSLYNDEEILAQTMSLGEEFLQLLLTIVGERYRVGIGMIEKEDVIKNELIQLLCISPSTRSDLSQKLYCSEKKLDCIKVIANLKRTNESSTGKYELKEEYYQKFNPFFYHYSRRQQSNALDAQLKRKKILKDPFLCCPPPKPVELTRQFENLNELLKCNITMQIIAKILMRALGLPAVDDANNPIRECSTKAPIRFTASDLQLDQCLHLIGLGLYEQERKPLEFNYLKAAHSKDIFNLLRDCYEEAKRSKDLVLWLMKKTNDLIETLQATYLQSLDEDFKTTIQSIHDCFNGTLMKCNNNKQDNKNKNSELAAQRRERIMAMMKANQDKFLSSANAKQLAIETESRSSDPKKLSTSTPQQTLASTSTTTGYVTRSGRKAKPPKSVSGSSCGVSHDNKSSPQVSGLQANNEVGMECSEEDEATDTQMDAESINFNNEGDADLIASSEEPETNHLCILCRDEQKIGFNQPTMVLLAYVQRSSVLSKNRGERRIPNYALTPSNQLKHQSLLSQSPSRNQATSTSSSSPNMYSFTSDNSWSFDATFMPSDLFFGPHISTCGHVMHFDCWQGFFDAISRRETSRPNRNARHVSFELDKNEILCPLCECISNVTIPLLPNYTCFSNRRPMGDSIFSTKPEIMLRSSENLSACLNALRGTVDMFKHIRHIKEVSTNITINYENKYIKLLQPKNINDVLEELDEKDALGLRDFINSIRSDKVLSNDCTKNLLNSISSLAERIHSIGLDLDKSITDTNHARIFMMTSWTVSYTLQSYERSARFKGTPLFDDIESSKNLCLSSLLRFACGSMMTHQSDMIQSLLVRKLRYLLINDEHLGSSPCCLDIDAFETFVSLFILLQKLYAHIDDSSQIQASAEEESKTLSTGEQSDGGEGDSTILNKSRSSSYAGWCTRAFDHEYFRNILHLMLILDSVQVIITLQNELAFKGTEEATRQNSSSTSDMVDSDSLNLTNINESSSDKQQKSAENLPNEHLVLHNFYKDIILASGHPNSRMPELNDEFLVKFKSRLLPFLRSAAIFFFQLSNIKPPNILRKASAFNEGKDFLNPQQTGKVIDDEEFVDAPTDFSSRDSEYIDREATNLEYSAICEYLNLPEQFSLLYQSHEARHLARSWLRHSRVLILIKSALSVVNQERSIASKDPSATSSGTVASSKPLKRSSSSSNSANSIVAQSAIVSGSNNCDLASTSQEHQQQTELMPVKFIRQPHTVNRLIDLPYDYSELVDKVSDFTCPSIKNEDSRTPTMCLICGVMLCSQSYCCQRDLNELASNYKEILKLQQLLRQPASSSSSSNAQQRSPATGSNAIVNLLSNPGGGAYLSEAAPAWNAVSLMQLHPIVNMATMRLVGGAGGARDTVTTGGASPSSSSTTAAAAAAVNNLIIHQQLVGSCTYHAYECSGGVGVFLRIRNSQILLLSGKSKGCYMPAPYIDDHGETDFGLMRGNPLHLNRQHYEKLQQMWLSHSIPEQISRTLEYSPYASSINWHLH